MKIKSSLAGAHYCCKMDVSLELQGWLGRCAECTELCGLFPVIVASFDDVCGVWESATRARRPAEEERRKEGPQSRHVGFDYDRGGLRILYLHQNPTISPPSLPETNLSLTHINRIFTYTLKYVGLQHCQFKTTTYSVKQLS